MNLRREKRPSWETPPAEPRPEVEWKCNCRARHYVGAGRGRRNTTARIPMNIRHQRHCAELENIRERIREKREKRQEKFRERTGGKTEDSDRSQPARKRRRIGDDQDNSDSEDEKCNGGLRMFQGTLVMMKQRERRLVEKRSAPVPPTPMSRSVDLVGYQDQQSDDDEAPTEVKTVVSYENFVAEEEKSEEVSKEPSLVKKSRKKKKKSVQVSDAASSNPPIPGEEDQEPDVEVEDNVEEVPEIPEVKAEESPAAAPETEKLPAVFRKRLRQPTLLERLLLSEIKKERNTILQCVRYVCKNNFFQQ